MDRCVRPWFSDLLRIWLLNDIYIYIVSTPYSNSCRRFSADAEDQLEAAFGASQSLKAAHGTAFKVNELYSSVIFDNGAYQTGSLCSMLYAAPGNILDWMYV